MGCLLYLLASVVVGTAAEYALGIGHNNPTLVDSIGATVLGMVLMALFTVILRRVRTQRTLPPG